MQTKYFSRAFTILIVALLILTAYLIGKAQTVNAKEYVLTPPEVTPCGVQVQNVSLNSPAPSPTNSATATSTSSPTFTVTPSATNTPAIPVLTSTRTPRGDFPGSNPTVVPPTKKPNFPTEISPTKVPTENPTEEPTEVPDEKIPCNNGEGNGGEGCSPSDNGNNDED